MESNVPPVQGPPPAYQQPPIIINVPPQQRGGGKGFAILAFFLLMLLGLMVVGRLASALFSGDEMTGTQSGVLFKEVVVENPGAADTIAVVDVSGLITSEPWDPAGRSMVDQLEDQLKVAAKDPAVKAVILKVDSPGGEVMASDDISRALINFQERHSKPVVAAMGGLAASGGYYVSAPCRWIVANELTLTGSIGVIMQTINYRGLMDKVGVRTLTFKSGRFKDMLSGSKNPDEIDPAEKEMVQEMVNETFGKFKDVIREGRGKANNRNGEKGRKLAEDWEQYADGRVLTGKRAHELGFVDELGNFQTAIDRTKQIAGIKGPARVIRYQEPFDLSRMFGMLGSSSTKKVEVDVGLDLPKLKAGLPYFLSSSVVQ